MSFLRGGPRLCSGLLPVIPPTSPSESRIQMTRGGVTGLPLCALCNAPSKCRAFLEGEEVRLPGSFGLPFWKLLT